MVKMANYVENVEYVLKISLKSTSKLFYCYLSQLFYFDVAVIIQKWKLNINQNQ